MNRNLKNKLLELEALSNQLARASSIRQKRLITARMAIIQSRIDELVALASGPATIAVSLKRVELTNLINEQMNELTLLMEQEFDKTLKIVYNNSRVSIGNELGSAFDVTNEYQFNALKERAYKGATYSQRLYSNNKVIAERINKDIGRMLYQNASPADIKRQIMKDFNINYNAADRLIRTETSRFYNEAAVDSYKAAGISEVEWLTEQDDRTCPICGPLHRQKYGINQHPEIPAHPSCRCTLLPVID